MKNPSKVTPKEVKAAREASGLSQTKAARLIGYSMRSWQEWEGGRRTMRRIALDAFCSKSKEIGK